VILTASLTVLLLAPTARSQPYPTSRAARAWRPPPGFIGQAWCLHRHESMDWHRAWVDWRGRHSIYAGGMQFTESTWLSVGGRGEPWQWSPREQLYLDNALAACTPQAAALALEEPRPLGAAA
jgi:hypothetical protein